jgi:hypothetical protein
MRIQFADKPFETEPKEGMFQVQRFEDVFKIRLYHKLTVKLKLSLYLGNNKDAVCDKEEVANLISQFQYRIEVLVVTEKDFTEVFQKYFDAPTVQYKID